MNPRNNSDGSAYSSLGKYSSGSSKCASGPIVAPLFVNMELNSNATKFAFVPAFTNKSGQPQKFSSSIVPKEYSKAMKSEQLSQLK